MEERTFWQEHGWEILACLPLGMLGAWGLVWLALGSTATYYILGVVGLALFGVIFLIMVVGGFGLPLWWYHQHQRLQDFPEEDEEEFSASAPDPLEAVAALELTAVQEEVEEEEEVEVEQA